MSIRVKLNQSLLSKMRTKLRGESADILNLVERALDEQGSLENIHKAVQNGTEYSISRGASELYNPATTSIVNMEDTLYLLTDRLMEIDNTYQIKDNNWE